jgi:hypothetical protein
MEQAAKERAPTLAAKLLGGLVVGELFRRPTGSSAQATQLWS